MRSTYEGPHRIDTAFIFYQHWTKLVDGKNKFLVNLGCTMLAQHSFISFMPLLRSNFKTFDLVLGEFALYVMH